jgi:hypothetical protein
MTSQESFTSYIIVFLSHAYLTKIIEGMSFLIMLSKSKFPQKVLHF